MTRVKLLVEGQTEESFVNLVLQPHLNQIGVYVTPILLANRSSSNSRSHRGGVTSYSRIERDVLTLLADKNAWVSTIIDFHGLPGDFPGLPEARSAAVAARARVLETTFTTKIGHPRFRPYLVLHEFGALVLAVPSAVENHLAIPGLESRLAAVTAACGGPEQVNHGSATNPARRLSAIVEELRGRYRKVIDGPQILAKSGLAFVRAGCPHFDNWLKWLENLSEPSP